MARVEKHMEVVGSDGTHIGTLDYLDGDRIMLTRNDPAARGRHHSLEFSRVEGIEGRRVQL